MPGCPSDDALLAFIPGLLDAEDASVVSAHVQGCSTCQSRVTTLRKKLSSAGGNEPGAAATIVSVPGDAPREDGKAPPLHHREPTAATVAYVPKRKPFPKQLGPYQVLEPIGRGGMGLVFKGFHPRLRRHVAIKLLPGLHLADNTAIVRLQREQAAAGRVEHENIVYAFDAGEQDGVDYLVMEFVEGIDLGRLLAATGPLPVADACEIVRQAALGLAHIESCGLVHRDIKPSNLMLSSAGVVKILDLGLAKLREGPIDEADATHSGFLLGTADYIAPEQIDTPRAADVRSDLYSLGCTLFKLLVGCAPFGGEELKSVMKKVEAHRTLPPPPLRDLRPEIPEDLAQIVARLLQKDPADRLQRPQDLVSALTPLCAGHDLLRLARGYQEQEHTDAPVPPDTSHARSESTSEWSADKKKGARNVPRQGAWRIAIATVSVALALVVAGGIWRQMVQNASALSAPKGEVDLQLTADGPLSKELEETGEYRWVGHRGANYLNVSDDLQFLHADSETPQIVVLGDRPQVAGRLKVTINQVERKWEGFAGIVLGVRNEMVETPRGVSKLMTVFQLISFHRLSGRLGKGVDQDGVNTGYGMEVKRQKVYIDPDSTNDLAMEVDQNPWVLTEYEDVPFPSLTPVELELELSNDGIDAIRWNGMLLPKLTTPRVNSWFQAKDYTGPCGLYNKGHRGTIFSNVDFSPLQPNSEEARTKLTRK